MHKTLRRLPSLDFLRGFEAAGRRLSFTLAAEELFVTQSALSRQVKALEDALGVAAFRAQASDARADAGRRRVSPHRHRQVARARRGSRRRAGGRARAGPHRVHHRFVRRAVAHPAAADVSRRASGDRGLRLRRRSARGPRARRRRCRGSLPRGHEGARRAVHSSASACCRSPAPRWSSAARRSSNPAISRATCSSTSTIRRLCRGSTGRRGLPPTASRR